MKRTLRIAAGLVAAALLIITTAASARADRDHDHDHGRGWHRHRFYQLAETNVRQLVSASQGGWTLRAVVGVAQNARPYLAIERLSGNALRGQFFVWKTRLDGRRANLWQRLTRTRQVHLLGWQGTTLRFRLRIGPSRYRCTLAAWGHRRRVAACHTVRTYGGGAGLPPGQYPQGPQAQWNPAIVRACGNAVTGPRRQRACIVLAQRARFDPRPVIRACRRAIRGDSGRLACIRLATRAPHDPTRIVAACGRRIGNRLSCLRRAIPSRQPQQVYMRDHRR